MKTDALRGVRGRMRRMLTSTPAFLLLLTLVVYGPLIPTLGYYWDDWPVINLLSNDLDPWAFYAHDRPFSAWTYLLIGPVLGLRPIGWHLFTLLLRWLTTTGIWWTLKQVWPRSRETLGFMILLFAVYPSFTLQPMAVAFSQHFITFALFAFSIGAMLTAHRSPGRRSFWTLAALAAQLIHMLTMEYLWGLELIRPILLWMLPIRHDSLIERRRFTLRTWLPYLVVYAGLLIWRTFFLELPGGDPNALALLDLYRSDLFAGLLHSFNIMVRDLVYMLYKTWTTSLGPSLIDATDRFLLVSWGLAFAAGLGTFIYLRRWRGPDQNQIGTDLSFRSALPIGLFALGVSLLPSWITDNEISVGLYSSRFSIPAVLGSSLVIAAFIDLVLRRKLYKHIAISVLVLLATGVHLRNANDYRWDWVKQERFFRQFSERVPEMAEGTAIFSDGAIFRYVAEYPTASALNAIYGSAAGKPEQSYWFFELDDNFAHRMEEFSAGIPIQGDLRTMVFEGHSHSGLVIYFEPDTGSCLNVLSPRDSLLPYLPALTAEAAQVSDLERIEVDAVFDSTTLALIFGSPEPPAWCDFYQRMTLAQQRGDWVEILALAEQAGEAGLEPNNEFERFPTIEAQVRTDNFEAAARMILAAFQQSNPTMDRPAFCAFWDRIAEDDPLGVRENLGCPTE